MLILCRKNTYFLPYDKEKNIIFWRNIHDLCRFAGIQTKRHGLYVTGCVTHTNAHACENSTKKEHIHFDLLSTFRNLARKVENAPHYLKQKYKYGKNKKNPIVPIRITKFGAGSKG